MIHIPSLHTAWKLCLVLPLLLANCSSPTPPPSTSAATEAQPTATVIPRPT